MIKMTPEQTKILMDKALDKGFRAAARKDGRAALTSAGVQIPAGTSVQVYENGPSEIHAVLPEKGDTEALKQAEPNVVKVFEKAWADAAFKAELLKNPLSAIKSATSAKLPSNLKIVIHENTDKSMNFVMPYVPPAAGELSDADLEVVAGGKGPGGFPGGMPSGSIPGGIMSGGMPIAPSHQSYPTGFGGTGGIGAPGFPGRPK